MAHSRAVDRRPGDYVSYCAPGGRVVSDSASVEFQRHPGNNGSENPVNKEKTKGGKLEEN